MKWIRPTAALVSLAVGVSLAPSAAAYEGDDDLFLIGIKSENIDIPDSLALAAAQAVCADFDSGATKEDVVFNAMSLTGLDLYDAGFLGGAAIYAYCPRYESRIRD